MQDILPSCPEVGHVKHIYLTNFFTNIFCLSHQDINTRNVGIVHFSIPRTKGGYVPNKYWLGRDTHDYITMNELPAEPGSCRGSMNAIFLLCFPFLPHSKKGICQ